MTELKLKRIKMRNWMKVAEDELEFPDKGVVLVIGHNEASKGAMESNGAGKSSLGEALCKALVGVDGRYSTTGQYSRDEKGNMYVCVDTELHGKSFKVELGHKCKELSKTGEGLRFTYDGQEPVQRGHVNETRQEITSALGITPNLAKWAVSLDGDRLLFNRMSERDTVNLLMTALRQPSWDDIQKKAAKLLANSKVSQQTAASKLEHLKQTRTRSEQLIQEAEDDLEAEKKSIEAEEEALKDKVAVKEESIRYKKRSTAKLEARQKVVKKSAKKIDDESAVSQGKLEKKLQALNAKDNDLRGQIEPILDDRATFQAEKRSEATTLNNMLSVPAECPTCSKPWDKAHGKTEIEAQRKKIADIVEEIEKVDAEKQSVDGELRALRTEISSINESMTELRSPEAAQELSYEYQDNEEALKNLAREIADLRLGVQDLKRGPDRSQLERYGAILHERKDKVKDLQADLEDAASELAEAEVLVKVLGYWVEAYGATGIPNLILSDALKPLNDIARRVSSLMTGGTIEIVFDTSRKLVSGKTSHELVINVNNTIGSRRIAGSSKGESGLINLIIAETLSEVGVVSNRVGFRWYDEITNGKDPVVRKNILSYLRETAHRLGILIFIVDHHAEAGQYADHILLAEKTEEGTSYSWQK